VGVRDKKDKEIKNVKTESANRMGHVFFGSPPRPLVFASKPPFVVALPKPTGFGPNFPSIPGLKVGLGPLRIRWGPPYKPLRGAWGFSPFVPFAPPGRAQSNLRSAFPHMSCFEKYISRLM